MGTTGGSGRMMGGGRAKAMGARLGGRYMRKKSSV
jgi:hypothetical protein